LSIDKPTKIMPAHYWCRHESSWLR